MLMNIFSWFPSLLLQVRFLADLVNAKVVASSSIMNLFDTFITVTYEPDIPQVSSIVAKKYFTNPHVKLFQNVPFWL